MKKGNSLVKRQLSARCNCKRAKCHRISDEDRQAIFELFWNQNSSKLQRQAFLIAHTEQRKKKRAVFDPQKHRTTSVKYYLTVGTEKYSVCQKFFLGTLCISSQMVLYNLKKCVNGVPTELPKRVAHNKASAELHESVHKHIASFPKVESHYCRRDTRREYLEAHLNVREMHRLYQDQSSCNIATESYY
jgi:hypothetical protein